MRKQVVPVVLAFLVLQGTANPASAKSQEVVELRGVNHFRASTTSSILVRFPKPVDVGAQLRVSYQGFGRVSGLILEKRDPGAEDSSVLEYVSIRRCKERGCRGTHAPVYPVCFCNEPKMTGIWNLTVVADGAPVSVSLRIKGLAGHAYTEATQPVEHEIRTLKPRVDAAGTRSVVSFGGYTNLPDPEFGLMGLWVQGNPYAATAADDCFYYEGSPTLAPPPDIAFLPGCPGRAGGFNPYIHRDSNLGKGGLTFISAGMCCLVGLGGWYTTAASVHRHGAVALWIDLEKG